MTGADLTRVRFVMVPKSYCTEVSVIPYGDMRHFYWLTVIQTWLVHSAVNILKVKNLAPPCFCYFL